ncbi:MAG: alpha/beta fold hydrolase [Hyphomonadaceae bacterium]|nr:alpha/beta fold hydrolase [Hyphomonadaceae bacterium]
MSIARWMSLWMIAALTACVGEARQLSWHECDAALQATGRTIQCATLVVPEDWDGARRRTVELELVVVRAAAPVQALPPVIYLHGGPGGGVLDDLADGLRSPLGGELIAQDQDWVFFDQRGTGRSRPLLDCGDVALNDAGPASDEVVVQLVECGRRLAANGVDFSQYQSRNVARDVQAIRTALRIETFDLYGLSYGTRVAAAVLTHEPEGLRAIVYDSPWPPEAKWTEPGPGWVSREVRELLRACSNDAHCVQYGDLERELDALARRWLADDEGVVNARALALFLMDSVYDPAMVRALPRAVAALAGGDLSALQPYATSSDAGYSDALHMAVMCNEELPFERAEAVRANAAGDPVAEAVALTMSNYFAACEGFGHATPAAVEQQPVQSEIPALFLAAGIDAGCPAELSEAAVRGYAHGQLLVAPFSTHQVSGHSACARGVARAFLRDPTRPLDMSCLAAEATPIRFE